MMTIAQSAAAMQGIWWFMGGAFIIIVILFARAPIGASGDGISGTD